MKKKREIEKDNIEDLVRRAKTGEIQVIEDIIERYKGLIINEATRYAIPSYDFEDLIQHGYLTVIKSIYLYKEGSKAFHGYVINAVKNNMRYLLRGNIKHFREVPSENISSVAEENYSFTLEDQIIAYESVEKLYNAMDQLDEEERKLIENYYLKGKSMTDYSKENHIEYRNLIKMKQSALEKLQKILSQEEN